MTGLFVTRLRCTLRRLVKRTSTQRAVRPDQLRRSRARKHLDRTESKLHELRKQSTSHWERQMLLNDIVVLRRRRVVMGL